MTSLGFKVECFCVGWPVSRSLHLLIMTALLCFPGHLILRSLVSVSTEAGTLLLNDFNDFVVYDVSVQDGLQSSKLLFGHKDV